ncbi:YkvA family protein [Ensifer adhaerens]|uniref:YkvA family protein n=1 Tax=Ensifer adhaerens TaxID=106592 RepID=UPI0023A98134|nr:YkvA family protein [Ensifer adhaerens]WDZ78947.1 YkvA family protein [Ensifer adhaerens]
MHASPPRGIQSVKQWARQLKRDVVALWFAARDPRTPLSAKLVAGAVAAYALSPIDLIPDFVPVLGYLDDLLIVPLGILLAIRLVPSPLMQEFRARAAAAENRPTSRGGLITIICIWLLTAALTGWLVWDLLSA